MSVAVDATTQKVLLIVAALLVGSNIGLAGALLIGLVDSARARRSRPRTAPPSAPMPPATDVAPQPLGEAPSSAQDALVAPALGSVPALFALDADVARDRHRDLYDVEYAKQLHHVDTLRRSIGIRLAVAADPPAPPDEPEA